MPESQKRRKGLLIAGIVAALLLILLLAAPFLISVDSFRPYIQTKLSAALGRSVQIGHLDLSLLKGSVEAEAITIGDDPAFSREPFLRAKSLAVGVELMPLLLHRELHVESINVDSPDIRLLRSPANKWNYESLGGASAGGGKSDAPVAAESEFTVQKVTISNGHVTLARTGGGPVATLSDVSLTASDIAPGSKIPLAIAAKTPTGGKVKLDGTVGPLDPKADIARAPVHLKFNAEKLPAHDVQGILEALGTGLPQGSSLETGTITAALESDGPLGQLITNGPVTITGVKLSGFDFASSLGAVAKLTGLGAGGSDTRIDNASSRLRVAPDGIRAEQINISMPALGTVTGAGTVSPDNHLNFHLVAKLNSSLNVIGTLAKLPGMGAGNGELPFRIEGTTSRPVFIPEMGSAIGGALESKIPQPAQGLGGALSGLLGKKKKP